MVNRRGFFAASSLMMAATGCKALGLCGGCNCDKAQFKLGFAPYTYNKYDIDAILDFAKKLDVKYTGIKYFMVKKNVKVEDTKAVRAITDAEIAAFKAKMAKAGVEVSSVGPVYMTTEDECRTAFEFTKRMGVKVLVAVPSKFVTGADGKKTRVASRELCEYASKCCAEFDIRFAIHNHGPDSPKFFPTGKSAYDMVKDLDPRMGLCLDIGHDFRFGYDPCDSIRRYSDRLFDMHLKNVVKDETGADGKVKRNQARQFPRGSIDLVAIAKALKDVGYTGACEIEYERDFSDNYAAMAENVGYFRGIMDSLNR